MIEIQWQKLLSTTRVRDLFREAKSRKVPSDFRSEFERDYGRAIFSTPVRRLQDKAQVFPLEAHDAVRTRLTHSLEVSSVARNMAQEVGSWLFQMGHLKQDDVGATLNYRGYMRANSRYRKSSLRTRGRTCDPELV